MSIRMMLLAIILMSPAQVGAQTFSEKAATDAVVHMSREEPAMRKAFSRAAATLTGFLNLAANPKQGTSNYALKVAISEGRNTEYFWVSAFSNEGDVFTGTLDNEPRLVKKHKLGERITFKREQIADWTYIDRINNKTVG